MATRRFFKFTKDMQDTIIATGANLTFAQQIEIDIENWELLSSADKAIITSAANTNNFQFDRDQET